MRHPAAVIITCMRVEPGFASTAILYKTDGRLTIPRSVQQEAQHTAHRAVRQSGHYRSRELVPRLRDGALPYAGM